MTSEELTWSKVSMFNRTCTCSSIYFPRFWMAKGYSQKLELFVNFMAKPGGKNGNCHPDLKIKICQETTPRSMPMAKPPGSTGTMAVDQLERLWSGACWEGYQAVNEK